MRLINTAQTRQRMPAWHTVKVTRLETYSQRQIHGFFFKSQASEKLSVWRGATLYALVITFWRAANPQSGAQGRRETVANPFPLSFCKMQSPVTLRHLSQATRSQFREDHALLTLCATLCFSISFAIFCISSLIRLFEFYSGFQCAVKR